MQISSNGITKLKREEGEKLKAYLDSRGIPTIGVGHTGKVDGKQVALGMTITADKSSELLKADLRWVEDAIGSLVRSPLNQNQYDALCSLIFNIGKTAFAGSTVLRQLNLNNYQAAADAFLLWKKAGNDPDILLPRRQRERALFLS
ncbi:lysozyme [Salmonella enterica]|uniref:Lysozyme n=3 Tax=Salmonella enterica TaxID=28901 RepID=A0A765FQK0_SALER|nr:lysozyme [Salmonella enterica subsp. enterica serovar Rubislaw]EAN4737714.1 lysozyme [Salmonella enterica subsp. enterica serovar Soerenga]EAP5922685.1 lysozyme [Salmonella enterica]EBY3008632.1 lysozyme [Salmonella enterica subsp. enterica serovar Ekpoui]EBY5611284.1 lysozyme [Salmonella enterica subsp. enterica serovar Chicago]ECI4008999.1 lysozyme [Salmonella enterica subsp. salamae]ECS4134579.1 lysozyme [Salmonella enterica subsp. enterica serovar Nima]EDV2583074.1 lysozyme [Salmonell